MAVRLLGHGEGGSGCLHPSISAAEINDFRFLAERMRILVSTLLDVYAFMSARLGNTEPETQTRASTPDAPDPKAWRQSAEVAATIGQRTGGTSPPSHVLVPRRTK